MKDLISKKELFFASERDLKENYYNLISNIDENLNNIPGVYDASSLLKKYKEIICNRLYHININTVKLLIEEELQDKNLDLVQYMGKNNLYILNAIFTDINNYVYSKYGVPYSKVGKNIIDATYMYGDYGNKYLENEINQNSKNNEIISPKQYLLIDILNHYKDEVKENGKIVVNNKIKKEDIKKTEQLSFSGICKKRNYYE